MEQTTKRKIDPLRFALLMLQGALVGCGAILPGVSGGVLCAAFGIYEPIMDFLANPIKGFRRHIRLLIPVILGGLIGFVGLAKLVELLLGASPFIAMMLFCGLICGTVPDMAKKAVKEKPNYGWIGFILALAGSFAIFTLLSGAVEGNIAPNFGWYIFCGVIWAFSMVIPGLSSSSILLFMGLYEPMTEGIGNFKFTVLIPLGIGFVVTILATARGINFLFRRFNPVLSKIILGFVISSVLVIFPLPEKFDWTVPVGILLFAVGFALAVWMGYMESKKEAAEAALETTIEPKTDEESALDKTKTPEATTSSEESETETDTSLD